MNNRQKTAITNLIRAAENPKRYAIDSANSVEQNKAVIRVFKTLFNIDENGVIIDFNDDMVEALCRLTERSSIDFL